MNLVDGITDATNTSWLNEFGWPLIWTIFGAFLGTLLGFFVTKYFGLLDYTLTKYLGRLKRLFPNKNVLINNSNNIYNSFISFDKTLHEFSEITSEILSSNKQYEQKSKPTHNNSIIITNIKEPYWYWEEFKKEFSSETDIGKNMSELEVLDIKNTSAKTDVIKAKELLNTMASDYFNSNNLKLFPHQKTFKKWESNKIYRMNIFKLVLKTDKTGFVDKNVSNAQTSNNEWLIRNPLHTSLFFEKIFSKGIKNYVINPFLLSFHKENRSVESIGEYVAKHYDKDFGTDSIIFSNKEIYNYDPEIGAINYYKINRIKHNNIKSFFNRVENTEFEDFPRFKSILKNYDLNLATIKKILDE